MFDDIDRFPIYSKKHGGSNVHLIKRLQHQGRVAKFKKEAKEPKQKQKSESPVSQDYSINSDASVDSKE